MDKSLDDRLAEGLVERFPTALGIRVEDREGRFVVRVGEGEPILTLSLYRGEWLLAAPAGHAHLETFEDAMALAFALLAGEARFAEEFRGGALAATWIEAWDGEAYEARHTASFLSPFERDEWTLWPDERWRVVRKTIALGTTNGEESFERLSDHSVAGESWASTAFEKALGSPAEGMKWAVGGQSRFVFQAPRGWRRRQGMDRETEREHNMIDFAPHDRASVFRVRCYFRDAEVAFPKPDAQTLRPYSVEPGSPSEDNPDPEWHRHAWTLLFSDGESEMMGVIELFFTDESQAEAERCRSLVEATLGESRYVPGEWTMSPEF